MNYDVDVEVVGCHTSLRRAEASFFFFGRVRVMVAVLWIISEYFENSHCFTWLC